MMTRRVTRFSLDCLQGTRYLSGLLNFVMNTVTDPPKGTTHAWKSYMN